MDAKNLAVLMRLKELMSSKGAEELVGIEQPASATGKDACPQTSFDKGRKGSSRYWGLDESATYRGIDVGPAHYKALVEAVSSTSTANILKKLEALACYLEKAPNDQGARKSFDRLSQAKAESVTPASRRATVAKPSSRSLQLGPDIQIRAECSKCRNVYAVNYNKVSPSWVCKSCLRLEKIAKQDEAQALTDRQYSSGMGSKVRQIETKITALKAIIESGSIENPIGLLLQISQLEKRLKLEKVHAISGIRKIRAYRVSGSYGSAK